MCPRRTQGPGNAAHTAGCSTSIPLWEPWGETEKEGAQILWISGLNRDGHLPKGMLAIVEQMRGSDSPYTYLDSPSPTPTSPRWVFPPLVTNFKEVLTQVGLISGVCGGHWILGKLGNPSGGPLKTSSLKRWSEAHQGWHTS